MLSSHLHQNQESEIYNRLEEFLERERIKLKQSSMTSLTIVLISQDETTL